ncbi:hypothetical protein [endosymbiont GvMRE of Glomus versiforme]|uniref:hypothetical protein n=1 Tax=endosymbiont GvMRE of Glomus versiforme TaxID=2039283 RepID=UPI000EC601E3|nr:hypothetical protein [endosymbiont GvMRE of Glomus versiforme]RHZ37028.1 hypothetical protein GvMRE_I2g490 [endosymbiont GvMRE of Glomus versiforme]
MKLNKYWKNWWKKRWWLLTLGATPPSMLLTMLTTNQWSYRWWIFILYLSYLILYFWSVAWCYHKKGWYGAFVGALTIFPCNLLTIWKWSEWGILEEDKDVLGNGRDKYTDYAYFRCKHCRKQWRVSYETQKSVCKECYEERR